MGIFVSFSVCKSGDKSDKPSRSIRYFTYDWYGSMTHQYLFTIVGNNNWNETRKCVESTRI